MERAKGGGRYARDTKSYKGPAELRLIVCMPRCGELVSPGAGLLPKWAESGGIEQGGVTDLVAGAVFQATGFARREGGKFERGGETGEKFVVFECAGANERHAAGPGADVEHRNDGPGVDVCLTVPRGGPFMGVAEPQGDFAKV